MSQFKFRLETLMKIRERERDEAREELAKAYQAVDILGEQFRDVAGQQQENESQRSEVQAVGKISVDSVIEVQRYRLLLRASRNEVVKQIEQVEVEVERRRQVLIEADREVRVLEKLKEKQMQRHAEEQDRIENNQMDEFGTQQAVRKLRAEQ